MSMIMRSSGSQSITHELLAFILSHLPSHRLQPPWGEIRITLLGHLPHFLFLLPFWVIFFLLIFLPLLGHTSFTALIRVYFPAHGTSPFEAARDNTVVGSLAPAGTVLSGFCADLAVAGPCISFNIWLPVCISIFILTCRFYRP
jgi:hypothetical protein